MKGPEKVVVTGASGLLGRELVRVLSESYSVEGWAFSRDRGLKKVDLLDSVQMKEAFKAFSPQVLVHAAAERRPDIMQKYRERSWELNVSSTARLASLCDAHKSLFVFLSTNYIFDGTSPPYTEEAPFNPLNFYGESKAKAEEAVRVNSNHYVILRVPILYGPSCDPDESSVTILIRQFRNQALKEVYFDDASIRYPTLTTDVANTIRALIERDAKGIIHYTGEEAYTKYGMAVIMASCLKTSTATIYPDPKPRKGAPRPLNAHLSNLKIRRLGLSESTPFRQGIASVIQGFPQDP